MLFINLINLASVCAKESKKSKQHDHKTAATTTTKSVNPSPYLHLNGINPGYDNNSIATVTSDNMMNAKSAHLMTNSDVSNNNGWKEVCSYPIDGNNAGTYNLALPQNAVKPNTHYCIMMKDANGQQYYTNPYKCGENQQFAPSRSVEEEAKCRKENGEPTTYTTEQLKHEKKEGKKTTTTKKNTNAKNSASGIFCASFAGLVLAYSLLM